MRDRQRDPNGRAGHAAGPTAGHRGFHAAALGALLAVGTLSSCTGKPSTPAPVVPAATPSVTAGTADLHLPVEAYMLSPMQSAQLDWVRKAATTDCMRRYGLELPVPARPTETSPEVAGFTVMNRRYGITDPAGAAVWGYHPPQAAEGASEVQKPILLGQLPAAERTVLMGIDPTTGAAVTSYGGKPLPEHGCMAELDRLLPGAGGGPAGPAGSLDGITTDIKARAFTDSAADSRVVSARSAWSSCMKGRGYDLPDPMKAPENVASITEPKPSTEEIAQATADVACKSQTNFAGIWFAVESDLQNAAITAHSTELKKVKLTLDAETDGLQRLLNRNWDPSRP